MIKEKEVIAEDDEVISPGKLENESDNISGYPGLCCSNMEKQDLADMNVEEDDEEEEEDDEEDDDDDEEDCDDDDDVIVLVGVGSGAVFDEEEEGDGEVDDG